MSDSGLFFSLSLSEDTVAHCCDSVDEIHIRTFNNKGAEKRLFGTMLLVP